ncbi:MAG: 2-dehydropantoate 2-reductase [Anaerolineaceae bacterium]|nr:2-dehydropantoate 2-reductase [Anaerolineaceae bacterium]
MTTKPHLKILVFGAGAIGTYVGGSLMNQGNEVVFLERPSMIDPLKKAGLEISVFEKKIRLPDPILFDNLSESLREFHFDLAILAVKSYDTDEVIKGWSGLEELMPPVLCLQNGVENEQKIRAVLGNDRVLSGTVTTAIGKPSLGKIVVEKLRGIGIAGESKLSQTIVTAMNEAGLNAELIDHAGGMKWSKMLTNLLANASSAILRLSPEKIFNNPDLYKIEVLQIRETLNVMNKLDIPVVNLPGTPVRLMAFLIQYMPIWLSRFIMKRAMSSGRGGKMPSFYLDLESGRKKSEVIFLNGAVARYAEANGLDAPVNQTLNDVLMGIVEGSIPSEVYDHHPQKLIQKIL